MNARSTLVSRLKKNAADRESYLRGKLGVVIAAQLRALRGRHTQAELAEMLGMKQSRISAMENPGAVNFSLETLVRIAAALKIAVKVEFCSYSELVHWENSYQPTLTPTCLDRDTEFLTGVSGTRISQVHVSGSPLAQGTADSIRINGYRVGGRYGRTTRVRTQQQFEKRR